MFSIALFVMFQSYTKHLLQGTFMGRQVVSPFVIHLIYRDTSEVAKINSFEQCENLIQIGKFISTLDYRYGKPIGFKLIELRLTEDSVKFTNWLQSEFKSRFDYDPLMWLAGVGTFPVEFHKHLVPFNTTKDP